MKRFITFILALIVVLCCTVNAIPVSDHELPASVDSEITSSNKEVEETVPEHPTEYKKESDTFEVVKEDASLEGSGFEENLPESQDLFLLCDKYLEYIVQSCILGDYDTGMYYESLRNDLITLHNMDTEIPVCYQDLYYMAKIIHFEAGSEWSTDKQQRLVGAVLYNRSKSPEFPDSIIECVYQNNPVQYSPVTFSSFESTHPNERDVRNALVVLLGQFAIPETVVFQANFTQGSGVYDQIVDTHLNTVSYFCYSSYPELYE